MAALADLSDLINKATGGNSGTPENLFFHKQPRIAGAAATALIAGRPASLWLYDGQPSAGVAPTTVAIPDNTTAGGLLQTDPGGGRQKFLYSMFATGLVPGTLILYDRLLHIGGLSATSTSAQTVGGTLTRYTNGAGNVAWAEIYTIIGTTATTIKLSDYTNQAGTDNQVGPTTAFGGTGFREVTRIIDFPLASGDSGIRDIDSVQVTASTLTAGNFGVTIAHPLAYIGVGAAGGTGWRDFATGLPGIPEILTDACLAFRWRPQLTTAPEIYGGLSMLES
jgi:hypothetical protein